MKPFCVMGCPASTCSMVPQSGIRAAHPATGWKRNWATQPVTLEFEISADWSSASQVMDIEPIAGPDSHHLIFSHGVKLDMQVFIDVARFRDTLGISWFDGRLYFKVDNLFGSATAIRDGDGIKVDYYRGTDANAGRTIHLSFRKLFQ